jgi:hypothetical protein
MDRKMKGALPPCFAQCSVCKLARDDASAHEEQAMKNYSWYQNNICYRSNRIKK